MSSKASRQDSANPPATQPSGRDSLYHGMPTPTPTAKFDLAAAATAEMIRDGFHIGYPPETAHQLAQIRALPPDQSLPDLRAPLWSSIDNDTSRDLDQIEFAARIPQGIRVQVGIADVAHAIPKDSPLDQFARAQTQTVYTAVHNFSMLPTELSTDLTSLNENQDRPAIVVAFTVTPAGDIADPSITTALVRNQAQLAYSKVGPWLSSIALPDPRVAADPALQAQLRLQDEAAQMLRANRIQQGALEFNRIEADPVVIDGQVRSIHPAEHTRASDLIEDFMIAANETMARTLAAAHRSSIRRVVRSPERWSRIVDLAAAKATTLPATPDSGALNLFLQAQRAADPDHYPDLSLAIIKLMGPGEYALAPGAADPVEFDHFSLAARDYTHSTAPNRRFADLVTQRLIKALIANQPPPYTDDELTAIAQHCTEQDSAARKVERSMQKRVAAVALAPDIGKTFRGVITGANDKGTFVRVFDPPVEGKIVRGDHGLDVGDTVTVTLSHTDPAHAFIDFTRP